MKLGAASKQGFGPDGQFWPHTRLYGFAMDLDLVQPQEGEYVVALYEFPHHPCRILDPQRC